LGYERKVWNTPPPPHNHGGEEVEKVEGEEELGEEMLGFSPLDPFSDL